MLQTLYISNYALIDRIEIEFDRGLNIVTGETGSGKSIILGALGLLMGERADTRTIRNPEKKTVVEAVFGMEDRALAELLKANDIDIENGECILRRELTVKGSSRAFINDTPVNLTVLKTVSERLLDIHTQHENLLLTDPQFQLDVIDSIAGNADIVEQYKAEYQEYKALLKRYTEFRDSLKRTQAQSEYNTYMLEQLDDLDLKEGEQAQLEADREIAENVTEIKENLDSILNDLSRGNSNALDLIASASHNLGHLQPLINDFGDLNDRLESARIEINDIVETLEEYYGNLSDNDLNLEEIQSRLNRIYTLQARHNVKTDRELIELRQKLKQELGDAENGDEILAELETQAKNAKKKAVLTARRLSATRAEAAVAFAEQLKTRCLPLGMPNLRCDVRVTQSKLMNTGADNVEFMFAFNKNQALMPIGKTASGGEIARVILAIKSILVDKMNLPTIIFDEVDTGVSGEIANRMAELMCAISRSTQVITITHIATVAAHGKRHFKVYKEDVENSTNTNIRLLDGTERVRELAAMVSGNPDDASALQTARTMLDNQNTD